MDEKKTIAPKEEAPKELTFSEEFMLELDTEEQKIFTELKETLMGKCELLEFEAVNEDNLDEHRALITYIKNGVISIESDGVRVNLRRPIVDKNGSTLADSVVILYDRNEARERAFTKGIKLKKDDLEAKKEYTRASLAASFKNAGTVVLGADSTRKLHDKDYMLLLTCYSFFRN